MKKDMNREKSDAILYWLEFIIPFVRNRQFYSSVWNRKVLISQILLYTADMTFIFKIINVFIKKKKKGILLGDREDSKSVATTDFTTVNFIWEALRHNARQITRTNENKMILCTLAAQYSKCPDSFEMYSKTMRTGQLSIMHRILPNEHLIINIVYLYYMFKMMMSNIYPRKVLKLMCHFKNTKYNPVQETMMDYTVPDYSPADLEV